jgi:putative nucleotidyltransferase with HDIG domain
LVGFIPRCGDDVDTINTRIEAVNGLPVPLIVITVIFVVGFIAWAILINRPRRYDTTDAPGAEERAPVEEISDGVASAASSEESTTNEEEVPGGQEKEEEDGINEPAFNNHLILATLKDEYAEIISSKLTDLPPLPRATLNLVPLLSSPRTNARDIAKVVQSDPLLAGKILRRVNSVFYSLGSKVDSIQHAVALLGFDSIRAISLRESFDSMIDPDPVEDLTANLLWRHSAAVSLVAKHLAHGARNADPDLVASAAILHDIGLLVMMAIDRIGLSDALRLSVKEKRPLCDCEESLYGFNHQVLGGVLGKLWGLSDELCAAIGRHHSPLDEGNTPDPVSGVIWLAHSAASKLGYAHRPSQLSATDGKEIANKLGLRWPVTYYINENLVRELKKVLSLWEVLGLVTPEDEDIDIKIEKVRSGAKK